MKIKVDPEWWKFLFDEIYLTTDARTVCNDQMTREEIDLFSNMIPIEAKDSILDFCGGHGGGGEAGDIKACVDLVCGGCGDGDLPMASVELCTGGAANVGFAGLLSSVETEAVDSD